MNLANKNKLAYVGSKPGDSRDSDTWFTPSAILDRVRWSLDESTGCIDFDPFSSKDANNRHGGVNAKKYFTKDNDAITTAWPKVQKVFMNPPYGRGLIHAAIQTFITHLHNGYFQRGVILVNNATETIWFNKMRQSEHLVAICFPLGRIAFENVDGKNVSGNTRGQVFLFFDTENKLNAQRRAKVAFEGIPDNENKKRFPFMGYVDSINRSKKGAA